MNEESSSPASLAKTMKWVPMVLGIVSLLLGAVALLVKMEDAPTKSNMLLFAAFGLFGIVTIVFGLGLSYAFASLSRIEEKTSSLEEEDDLRNVG